MNMIWVTDAEYLNGYTMKLKFNDGNWRTFDFSRIFGTHPMYDKIRDLNVFRQFSLDGWAVSWLNNTVDVAPEYLYENSFA